MNTLPVYCLEPIIKVWNQYSAPLRLRGFVHSSNSASKSAKRLTIILRDNARLLNHHPTDDIQDIASTFETTLQIALAHLQAIGLERFQQRFGEQYRLTLGFWTYCRDLRPLTVLANEATGRTPAVIIQEKQQQRTKAALIKSFKADVDDFISTALRLSNGDTDKLAAALKTASHQLALAEDRLRA